MQRPGMYLCQIVKSVELAQPTKAVEKSKIHCMLKIRIDRKYVPMLLKICQGSHSRSESSSS